jgi:PAT family beta-lactamase induction signal transducer AmpG
MTSPPKLALDGRAALPHPMVFMFMVMPFGATSGFVGVCLAYLLTQAGLAAAPVAALVAISYLPHTWKFLWAPVVDLTLTRKAWYGIGLVGVVAGIGLSGSVPMNEAKLPLLTALVLLSAVAATLVGMSVEWFMAHLTPEDAKGRASGWFQAGNLGGSGLGGGLALWLVQAQGVSAQWASWGMAGLLALCALPLLRLHEPQLAHAHLRWSQHVKHTALELWEMLRSRTGAMALLICFLPIGTGALSNLWSLIANEWQASATTVALVTGTVSGVLSALGCLLGGWACDRMDRKWAYCCFGLVLASITLCMAFGPRAPMAYITFTCLYAVVNGMCYAAFSAVVLEAIGKGAAATKYNVLASLANFPIMWITGLSGAVLQRQGSTAALGLEMALALVAVVLFVLALQLGRRKRLPQTV